MEPSNTEAVAIEEDPNASITLPSSTDPGTVEASQDGMTLEPMYKELLSTSGDINQAPFLEPALGMTFDSYKEAEQFYNTYARHVGFGTRIKCTSRSKVTNETNRVVICCNKEGFKPTRKITTFSKPITRIGCMARMRVVKQNSSRKWVVTDLHLPHNHVCFPHMARFYRSHKRLESAGKKENKLNYGAGNKVNNSFGSSAVDAEGHAHLSYGQEQTRKHLKLKEGDAIAIQWFFKHMQSTNRGFYYLMDFDAEGRLRNVFWADVKSRAAYEYFGDVITFDTTYLIDGYEIPLVSFVGANHHGQSVLLGCGLLADDTIETYIWLFKSWLNCMSGRAPNAIISDYSESIQVAIREVFPAARHRLCLCHIMKKAPSYLEGLADNKAIKKALKKAVYDSIRIDEFESAWRKFIEEFQLEHNQWLDSLYELRHQWVPVFVKDTFCAGMSIIQRGESVTTFFDGYVQQKTALKEFVEKYEVAIKSSYEREAQADFESYDTIPIMKTRLYCESQLAKVYTGSVFMQFQEEIYGTFNCYNIEHTRTGAQLAIYTLKERIFDKHGNMIGVKDYEVLSNEAEIEFQCICRLFQYKGILCRHVLYVLNHLGVNEIPNRYIITRWRKDFKRIHALHTRSNGVMPTDALQGYDDLYQRFIHLVEEGSLSADRYELAVKGMTELMDKILAVGEDLSKSYTKAGKPHNAGDADTTNKSKRIKNPGASTTPVMNPYVVRDPSKAWQQGHTKGGRHRSGDLGTTNRKH
ncbi:unnamed protein product [Victoria cruziana]